MIGFPIEDTSVFPRPLSLRKNWIEKGNELAETGIAGLVAPEKKRESHVLYLCGIRDALCLAS